MNFKPKWTFNIGDWQEEFCMNACFHQQTEWADAERACFHPANCTGVSQRMSDAPPDLGPKEHQDVDVETESGAESGGEVG